MPPFRSVGEEHAHFASEVRTGNAVQKEVHTIVHVKHGLCYQQYSAELFHPLRGASDRAELKNP